MAFDSYGLAPNEFKKLFLAETENLVDLFLAMQLRAEAKGLRFDRYDNTLLWSFFQEVGYRAEDAARVHQKKYDPEAIKEHSFDYGLLPTREEMMEEIKSLKELMSNFVEQNKDGYLGQDRDSNFPGEGG